MGCETEYNLFTSGIASSIDELVRDGKRLLSKSMYQDAADRILVAGIIQNISNRLNKEVLSEQCRNLPGNECENMLNLLGDELNKMSQNEENSKIKNLENIYIDRLKNTEYRKKLMDMCEENQLSLKKLI